MSPLVVSATRSLAHKPGSPADPSVVEADVRILVVDDEPQVARAVARALGRAGFDAIGCTDPAEALELLTADPRIGMLVTDVVMPKIDGRRLAREARARRPGLRVLYISGYAVEVLAPEDVADLLPKPFTNEQLVARVRAVLASST